MAINMRATLRTPFDDWQATPGGLYLPQREKPRRARPIAIDLFCGAGGFSLGFLQAGFEVVAAADHDVTCMTTYLYNLGAYPCQIVYIEPGDAERAEKSLGAEYRRQGWLDKQGRWKKGKGELVMGGRGILTSGGNRPPDQPGVGHFFLGDIRKLDGHKVLDALGLAVGEVDCIMGGPPCQGFSHAGKREVMDPRNSLVFDFMRLITEIRPKTMVMENVPGIASMVTPEGIPVIDACCRILEDGGYGGYEALRKTLLATAGAGAAMRQSDGQGERVSRRRNRKPDKRSTPKPAATSPEQGVPGRAKRSGATGDHVLSPAQALPTPNERSDLMSSEGIESVTLSSGGRSVTLTPEDWDEAVRRATGGVTLALDADPEALPPLPRPVDDFLDAEGRVQDYKIAPDLTEIAVGLMEEYPSELGRLRQFNVDYLWAHTLGAGKGEAVWFKLERPRKLTAYYAKRRVDLVIAWSLLAVKGYKLTNRELQAVVHFALACIDVNDQGEPKLLPPGKVETEIIRRYGAWSPRLKRILKAVADRGDVQLLLSLDGEEEEEDDDDE